MISHAWLQKRTYTDKDLDWLFTDPIYSSSKDKTTNSLKIFSDSRPVGVQLLFHVTFWNLVYKEMKFDRGRN